MLEFLQRSLRHSQCLSLLRTCLHALTGAFLALCAMASTSRERSLCVQACDCQAGGCERQSCELVRSQHPNAQCYRQLHLMYSSLWPLNQGTQALMCVSA